MINWTALTVFVILFGFVTGSASSPRAGAAAISTMLHEWGLGGRRFGTIVTWFLLGGDLYTAYTFIAVPALVFGAGAIGFFAVPYTIMIYPFLYLVFPRLWSVAHKHGYVTAADFVRGRYGNRWLALASRVTGILATMPYIALQLVGIQVVIGAHGHRDQRLRRRPAADHRLRDPRRVHLHERSARAGDDRGRQGHADLHHRDRRDHRRSRCSSAATARCSPPFRRPSCCSPRRRPGRSGSYSAYATLALGSACALFLYPHSITGMLSASQRARDPAQRGDAAGLFAVLGLLALLGFMAIAVGVQTMPEFADGFKRYGNNFAVPALFLRSFPVWFVGVAFAAIAIGALVPAAIMSIAAANTFTRNIYREFINPACTTRRKAQIAKLVSLVDQGGRAGLHLRAAARSTRSSSSLLGGVWIIQTLPSVILGLYTQAVQRLGAAGRLGRGIRLRAPGWRHRSSSPRSIRCTSWERRSRATSRWPRWW